MRQLERHIKQSAASSAHVVFTKHARLRMKERGINDAMLLEALRMGRMSKPPEPDMLHPGLTCRMQRFVAGVQVAAVVYVEYPSPTLVLVTVIDVQKE